MNKIYTVQLSSYLYENSHMQEEIKYGGETPSNTVFNNDGGVSRSCLPYCIPSGHL